jgi:hypothetical protein
MDSTERLASFMDGFFATPSSSLKPSLECLMYPTLIARTIPFTVLAKVVHAVPLYGVLSLTNCSRYMRLEETAPIFVSPGAKVSAKVGAVGFVDNTTEAINDFTNDSANPMMMVEKATKDAQ